MATEEQVFSLPWPDTSDPGPQVGDGRPYTDGEWRNVWRTMILGAKPSNAGVFNVPDDAEIGRLEVTSPGANQISVATGAACVDGLFVPVDTPVDLTPPSAGAGSTRQDRVVLRATWGAGASQYITVVAIKQGTQAGPPDLTTIHNSTWEISLARYTINDVGAISGLENERVYAQSVMRHEFEAQEAAFAAHQGAATLDHPNNSVTNAKLRDSAAVSVIGRSANSSGDPADIAAGANDRFLARVANALQWVQLTIGMIPDLLITEAKLAAAVAAKLVTNGNSHDHVGGDGAQINHTGLSNIGANTHAQIDGHIGATSAHGSNGAVVGQNTLNTHKTSGDHDGRYYTEGESDARFAPIAKGVTNGDSHDHAGGDGAQIGKAGMQPNSVDDSIVGDRVPAFIRRQGNSPTDWSAVGNTNYTPGAVRMQGGSGYVQIPDAQWNTIVDIWFPVSFGGTPFRPFLSWEVISGDRPVICYSEPTDGQQFSVNVSKVESASGNVGVSFSWLAIGPE